MCILAPAAASRLRLSVMVSVEQPLACTNVSLLLPPQFNRGVLCIRVSVSAWRWSSVVGSQRPRTESPLQRVFLCASDAEGGGGDGEPDGGGCDGDADGDGGDGAAEGGSGDGEAEGGGCDGEAEGGGGDGDADGGGGDGEVGGGGGGGDGSCDGGGGKRSCDGNGGVRSGEGAVVVCTLAFEGRLGAIGGPRALLSSSCSSTATRPLARGMTARSSNALTTSETRSELRGHTDRLAGLGFSTDSTDSTEVERTRIGLSITTRRSIGVLRVRRGVARTHGDAAERGLRGEVEEGGPETRDGNGGGRQRLANVWRAWVCESGCCRIAGGRESVRARRGCGVW